AEEDAAWAQQTFEREGGGKGLRPGDVVLAEVARETEAADAELLSGREDQQRSESTLGAPIGKAILRQVPEVDGAVMAMDPHTGRILAMAGGYSFWKNQYNRATQAVRQPGSAFKPFVYAAALEQGYTPVSKILDAPFVNFDVSTDDYWAPQNYTEGRFYGLQTMRLGLEKSRNTMTVRLAQDIGMEPITELAERVGLYDDLDPYLAMSIGAGETTMVRMMRAYAALVNGGVAVEPTILDRVQNRNGDTIYRHDERACETCNTDAWDGEMPPALSDDRRPVLDPVIAYQVTHMLEGVVERGTGRRAQRVGKPLAGKTGTTNDYFDAWFMGMSPDLVVGVWTGFDTPKTLGNGESGGAVAAPIFTEFMEAALENEPALPFRIPPGVRLVEVDATTGQLAAPGAENTILEAFRPGTEPGVAFDEDNVGLNLSGGGTGLFGDLSVDEDGEEGDEEDDESPLVLDSSSPY
ncbi:MAG: penicillin-binding transpeptidase domain-containing protein, partial [Pseudomonadota bacterium]